MSEEQSEGAETLAELGQKIAEKGVRLKELRKRRAALDEEIQALDIELQPLLARNAQIVAELIGRPVSAPAAVAQPQASQLPVGAPDVALRGRIVAFLKSAEPGVGAADVAEALHLDVRIVREAMRVMMTG